MSLEAPNILFNTWGGPITVTKSPLPYNDRRRFGSRLRKLYQHLKGLPKTQYRHSTLVTSMDEKAPACGSTACAFGHAVISGKFKDLGMTVRPKARAKVYEGKYSEDDLIYKVMASKVRADIKALGVARRNGGVMGAKEAADVYFGPGAWNAIFEYNAVAGYSNETTKKMVMDRIKLIAKNAYGVDVTK